MLKLKDLSTEEFCRSLNHPQLISFSNENRKPKMVVDNATMIDLSARALAISRDCKIKVIDMFLEGKTEGELLRTITDFAAKDPDAADKGELAGGTGLKKDTKGGDRQTVRSFEGLEDKDFFAGISQPSIAF